MLASPRAVAAAHRSQRAPGGENFGRALGSSFADDFAAQTIYNRNSRPVAIGVLMIIAGHELSRPALTRA